MYNYTHVVLFFIQFIDMVERWIFSTNWRQELTTWR